MSEGPLPDNWPDAARWLLGGVFVFVAGFEGYVMLWDGRFVAGLTSVAIAFALTALLVRWKHLEAWAGTQFAAATKQTVVHPATWLGTLALVFLLIALSPFVEEAVKPSWSIGVAAAGVTGIIFTLVSLSYHRTKSINSTAITQAISLVDLIYHARTFFYFDELDANGRIRGSLQFANLSAEEITVESVNGSFTYSGKDIGDIEISNISWPHAAKPPVVKPRTDFDVQFQSPITPTAIPNIWEHTNAPNRLVVAFKVRIMVKAASGEVVQLRIWDGVTCQNPSVPVVTSRIVMATAGAVGRGNAAL
jgi:hypothetical protein